MIFTLHIVDDILVYMKVGLRGFKFGKNKHRSKEIIFLLKKVLGQ